VYSFVSFLPTYFVQVRGLKASDAALLMMAYAVPTLLSGPLAGYVADRSGYRVSLVIYFVLLVFVKLGLPTMPLGIATVAVLIVWGLIRTWLPTAFNTLITRIVPAKTRGTYLGIVNACTFLGAATGPIIFGYMADIGGFGFFFSLALTASLLGMLTAYPVSRAKLAM
jgi:ACS family hexuronate transporter-like MFS transporter